MPDQDPLDDLIERGNAVVERLEDLICRGEALQLAEEWDRWPVLGDEPGGGDDA